MRPLPLVTAGVLVLGGTFLGGHELSTDYGKERSLRTTSELEIDLETTTMEMLVDDEPVEDDRPGGMSSSLVRKCVLLDEIREGAGAVPRRVRRHFEALKDESTFSFGGDERSDEREFPLQGVVLDLSLDDEGEVHAELVEGPTPEDDALLEGHALTLFTDAFLPEAGIELDGSWALEDEAVRRALGTALDARLFASPPPDAGGRGERGEGGDRRGPGRGPGGPGRNLGLLTWEGKAKLVAIDEEHGGQPCARIALELEGRGDLPEPSFRGGGRGFAYGLPAAPPALEGTLEAHLKGDLFVSLTERRPLGLSLDGELEIENRFEREREGRRFSSHTVQSGRLTLTVDVEIP